MLHRIIMRVRAWVNGENVVIKLSKISWKAISLQGAPCHVYTFVIINLSVQYQTTMIYIMILNAPCAVTKYTFSGSKAICRYKVHLHNIYIYIYTYHTYIDGSFKRNRVSHIPWNSTPLETFSPRPGCPPPVWRPPPPPSAGPRSPSAGPAAATRPRRRRRRW